MTLEKLVQSKAVTHALAEAQVGFPETNAELLKLLGTFFELAQYAGCFLMIWGIYLTITALKDETSESKVKATLCVVLAAALIGMKTILNIIFAGFGVNF